MKFVVNMDLKCANVTTTRTILHACDNTQAKACFLFIDLARYVT